jgi:hypothetical protein
LETQEAETHQVGQLEAKEAETDQVEQLEAKEAETSQGEQLEAKETETYKVEQLEAKDAATDQVGSHMAGSQMAGSSIEEFYKSSLCPNNCQAPAAFKWASNNQLVWDWQTSAAAAQGACLGDEDLQIGYQ